MADEFDDLFLQLHKMVYECIPEMKMVIKGMRFPTDVEEFVVYNDLGLYGMASRKDVRAERIFVEVIAYSKHADQRKDQKIKRAWSIAKQYYDLFNKARVRIENTCVQFKEPRLMALDLKSLGDFAQSIDQQSPALNLDAVVMEVEGIIIQSKES